MGIIFPVRNFGNDESGAVTVDWVVLTAAVVVISLAVVGVIRSGVETTSTRINNVMTTMLTNY